MSTTISSGTYVVTSAVSDYIAELEGEIDVLDGGSITDSIASNFGVIFIGSGGSGERLSAIDYGDVSVGNGGRVSDITATSDGRIIVGSGGIGEKLSAIGSSSDTVSEIDVWDGGSITDATVTGYAAIYLYGNAEKVTASNHGSAFLRAGITSDFTADNGEFNIYNGATLSNVLLQNGGAGNIYTAGVVDGAKVMDSSTIMNSAGILRNAEISGGSVTIQTTDGEASGTVMNGGLMRIVTQGNAFDTTMTDGLFDVVEATNISKTVVSGGIMRVGADNTILDTTVYAGGVMEVLLGGEIQDTTVDGGELNATSVLAVNTLIGAGGTAAFSSSTVTGLEIGNGGTASMDSDSTLTGTIVFDAGASITIDGTVVFDPLYMTMVNAQVTGLSAVSGNTSYTLTTTGIQAGSYKLATDAAGFTGSLTIEDETLILIDTEDGKRSDVVRIGDFFYQILLDTSNELMLKVMTPEEGNLFFSGKFAGGSTSMLARSVFGCVDIFSATGEIWGTLNMGYGGDFISVGDFNGDGFEDILRTNYSGQFFYDLSNGDGTFTSQDLGFDAGTWNEMGTGDFSGNGIDDILLADPNAYADSDPDAGQLAYKEYNAGVSLINVYRDGWEMIATGNFGTAASTAPDAPPDEKADMLWQNEFEGIDGATYHGFCTWITDSPEGSYWRMVGAVRSDEWDYLGAGDFNGDGTSDFAMINDAGIVVICGVQNGTISYWGVLNAVNTDEWSLASIGDFNGDGTDDIAWYCYNNEALSGLAGYWQINDMQTTGWGTIGWLA